MLSSLPVATREAILRMQRRSVARDGAILVLHRDPGRYRHFVDEKQDRLPDYEELGSQQLADAWEAPLAAKPRRSGTATMLSTKM